MLPERHNIIGKTGKRTALDGRYADAAIALLMEKMDVVGRPYKEYQVKIFGGGNMFPETYRSKILDIGTQNVQAAQRLVKHHGFTCVASHLGGIGSLTVVFEVWSGDVWIKRGSLLSAVEPWEINGN
jgi:chemotaxis protein CheD